MKRKFVFDVETDNLLPLVSVIWCLVLTDLDTDEVLSFSDYDDDLPSIAEGLALMDEAAVLAGHNIIGYDIPVLWKLLRWKPKAGTKIWDTWIMSQTLRYKRGHLHGLKGWGSKLGFPKLDWTDFTHYCKDMLTYCIRDVQLNVKVYRILIEEARKIIAKHPLFKTGLEVEMKFASLEHEIQSNGWLFNMEGALELLKSFEEKMAILEALVEPKIGMICVPKDSRDEFKSPKWRKDGCYVVHTANWFNIPIENGKEERLVEGDYCRVEFEQGRLGSIEIVKAYLFSIGWVPDDYNVERINGKFVNKSPKLTETSLSLLGEVGVAISDYNTIKSRKGILEGWIREAEKDGRLHGRMWTIGTPSFRCRHEVVANLPSVDSIYGKEMRALLTCEDDKVIIGADSSGNQMRGLCHYIANEDFTNEVIDGDVHQRNADTLSEVHPTPRKTAKPWLYAYLFGGGDGKLGLILTGKKDAKIGKASKQKFESSIPGLAELKAKLNGQFEASSNRLGANMAFIRGLDGRIVFVESAHKTLNYLLQTAEGITCKAAAVYLKEKLVEHNIPHYFTLHYHDEVSFVVPKEYEEIAMKLSVEAFTEAPKWFGIECMSGAAHAGKTYAEVH